MYLVLFNGVAAEDVIIKLCPVDTLITHTPWRTVQAMGFQGLWVAGVGKK
jgi:hypothetical protein